MILIGSQALQYRQNGAFMGGSDFDIVVERSDLQYVVEEVVEHIQKDGGRVDFSYADNLNNSSIATRFWDGTISLYGLKIPTLRGLAAIKRSHLWRDYFFDKHITIYHRHLAQHFHQDDWEWMKERQKLTKQAFGDNTPSLIKSNEEFFDDGTVNIRKYEHDFLHELVAYYDKPLFTRLKPDQDSAWCARDMWEALSNDDKLKCVAEETYVIGAERFLIPSGWTTPAKLAYLKALKKVCTTLTSGWFRDFAIDHYPELVNLYDRSKYDKLKLDLEAVDDGLLQKAH